MLAASAVDVLTSLVASNEGYGPDIGVGADVSDGVFATLDNVDYAIRDA